MNSMNISAGEMLTIIAAVAAAIVSVVNAIAGGWGRAKLQTSADTADRKLDHIKELTNSTMDALKSKLAESQRSEEALYDKLAVALARIDRLETLLHLKLGIDHAKKEDDDGA